MDPLVVHIDCPPAGPGLLTVPGLVRQTPAGADPWEVARGILAAAVDQFGNPLTPVVPPPLMAPRDPRWDSRRRMHLRLHPACEACGTTVGVLEPGNLWTLCGPPWNHHWFFGHRGESWLTTNPNVREDSRAFRLYLSKGLPLTVRE
jgi:hypothetical protein